MVVDTCSAELKNKDAYATLHERLVDCGYTR